MSSTQGEVLPTNHFRHSVHSTSVSSQTCQTASGPCVFPFKYLGVSYSECTMMDSTLPWCATSVDAGRTYTNYDYCPPSCAQSPTTAGGCQTVDGVNCIFPFVYQGTTYSNCTNADFGSTFWCATAVGTGNVYTTYGVCSPGCLTSAATTACKTSNVWSKVLFHGLSSWSNCTSSDNDYNYDNNYYYYHAKGIIY
ncbi:unnamed protein product [Lepeophtheirus salmonis]|uniref:(salmon louse) hypothetical protein n=1 Tax=Lepeophtheirus salmonis TaxID=72036 RepID=A0A7R8CNZ8_LEPSM|nr:unnamed protein product [Lepeophtheirus salmonis]CAF2835515.1 unnamed protein product [Lepeophtheirus salmonis]